MQTIRRTSSTCQPTCASARSRSRTGPRPPRPQSNSTIPSPAATAQALPCGTPGHGSGTRSRQTPGITRSPRPTSVLRVGLRTRADAIVAPMAADARSAVETYFAALTARDVEAAAACWAPDGVDNMIGQTTLDGPEGVRAFFGDLFAAMPDFAFAVESVTAEEDRVAVRWSATGTFSGTGSFQGIAPTGQHVTLTGLDLLHVRDGKLVHNDAFTDGLGLARQLGLMPPQGSRTDTAMLGAFNAKTRGARRLAGTSAEPVADGVWRVRGGVPRRMNVYLIADAGGGVTVFDAGVRGMGRRDRRRRERARRDQPRRAGPRARRPSRRGPRAGRRADPLPSRRARGGGGRRRPRVRATSTCSRRTRGSSTRGCSSSGTAAPSRSPGRSTRATTSAASAPVHLPGHAPGQIALFRERDGVALTTDVFYTLDIRTGLGAKPAPAHPAFQQDLELARASIRKLAELAPSSAWPGHAEPVTGDVAAELRRRRGDALMGKREPPSRGRRRARRAGVGIHLAGR